MVKIAFFELKGWQKEWVASSLKGHQLIFFEEPLKEKHLETIKDVEILGTFIYSELTRANLEKLPNLKFINTFSTGYDHIDLEYCKERGIKVANVPAYSQEAVAEHTLALIFLIARNLYEAIRRVKDNDFSIEGLEGFELAGKTLGIVGTGAIGSMVAKKALALGMKVIAYNRSKKEDLEKLGVKFVSYEELLSQSDIITFHLPLTPETHHFFKKEHLKYLKDGVIIINTARGALIETEALLEGLNQGKIKAIGLDVLEEEVELKEEPEMLYDIYRNKVDVKTLLESFILKERKNVFVTPHIAWYTKESQERLLKEGVENIKAFLEGKERNLIV
jgi:D-lactate dehydrogenase